MEEKETCNFCGLTKDDVEFMIQSPSKIYICNECIEACMELWQDFQRDEKQKAAYITKHRITDNLTD